MDDINKPQETNYIMSITSIESLNLNNIRYGAPIIGSVPDSKPPIQTIRVPITYLYPDGTYGPLLIPTERLFSFGLQENVSQETGKTTGFSFSLCMYNRDMPSQKEMAWVDAFNRIIEHSKDHLIEHRADIMRYELERSDLKKLNPMYYKKEKGVIVPGRGPTLYPKCIRSVKEDRILTLFYDSHTGVDFDPKELMGKYNHCVSVIKFESIFVGTQISYQIKMHECSVEIMQKGITRVLPRHEPIVVVQHTPFISETRSELHSETQSELPRPESPAGSLSESEEEEDEKVVPMIKPQAPPARTVRVVKKK